MKKLLLSCLFLATTMLTGCSSSSSELTIVHFDQTILGSASKDLGVSIGIKKGNDTLKTNINSSLAKLSTDTRNTMMTEAVKRSTGDASSASDFITNPTSDDANKETLIVGLECNYSPFNWTETSENDFTYPINGKVGEYAEGYDVQVAKFIANDLNMNLQIIKMDWESLVPALQNDTINAVIAGMTDTQERRESIDFTDEYYRSELVLVTRKGSQYDTNGEMADLANYKDARFVSQVSTVTNDIIDTWVTDYGVKHLNPMDTFATCAIAVKSNNADVMTAELPVATAIVNGAN